MRSNRLYLPDFFRSSIWFFALFFACWAPHIALASPPVSAIAEGIAGLETKKELPIPHPLELNPQWWHYFDAEGEELQKRVSAATRLLQEIFTALPIEEQNTALPLIKKISNTLNALPHAKNQLQAPKEVAHSFLKIYTLENQLSLHRQIHAYKIEKKQEIDHHKEAKERLAKAQKHIDNLMVVYLGHPRPSAKKLLSGLEIMAYQTSIALTDLTLKIASNHIESLTSKIKKLEAELEYSKTHLATANFNRGELETTIAQREDELAKTQAALSAAEANLLGVFNDDPNDLSHHFLLEQQLLKASVSHAHAWAKLTFHTFKYNLLLQLNDQLQDHDKYELRKNLNSWRDKVASMLQQANEWQKTALKEQDRIRQDFTTLIAQGESNDSKNMRMNHNQRELVLTILATVELLEEEIANTTWLIDMLDIHFQKNSSFLMNWWISLWDFFFRVWDSTLNAMNFSLFKITGIPITLWSILKIVVILFVTFWLAIAVRSILLLHGKKRGLNESTLYSLGGLARYFIFLCGFIIALCSIGLDFSNLIFIAGALMFGISLGLQSIANNFFCGLRILFERKLKIGDYVELHSGHYGKVSEIHIQNTVVITSDGQKVIIPNAELISHTLGNWTSHTFDYRRLHIPFSVAAGCDKEQIRTIVIEAAKRVPCMLKDENHPAEVWLVKFDHYTLDFKLVVWIDYHGDSATKSREADFLWEIETALRAHNIPLPNTLFELFVPKSLSAPASSH